MSHRHSSQCLRAPLQTAKVQAAATLLLSLMHCLARLSSLEGDKPCVQAAFPSPPPAWSCCSHQTGLGAARCFFCRMKPSRLFFHLRPSPSAWFCHRFLFLAVCRGPPAPGPRPPHRCCCRGTSSAAAQDCAVGAEPVLEKSLATLENPGRLSQLRRRWGG